MAVGEGLPARLRNTVERLYILGEAPAGTRAERLLAGEVRDLLQGVGADARLLPVPVAAWSDEGSLVAGCGFEAEAAAWPGSLGGEAEGEAVVLREPDAPLPESLEGRVLVAELPRDPDRALALYRSAARRGAAAIVFYDWLPGRLRRIVVTEAPLSLGTAGLAGAPAVHVRREDASRLLGCRRLRVVHGGRMWRSYGYIVEAVIEGGADGPEVMITAHHDHWLGGANDNLAGVAGVLALAELLAKRLRGAGGRVRVVSFTAEEFGDPGLPGWYWAYGSRFYVDSLRSMGLLDEVLAALNLDVAASPGVRIHATPLLAGLLLELAGRLGLGLDATGYDTTDSDSFSFSMQGIEAATLMGYDEWLEYYHSSLDSPERLNYGVLERGVRLYAEAAAELLRRGWESFRYTDYARSMLERLSSTPVLAAVLYKLYRATRAAEERRLHRVLARAYRVVNQVLWTAVYGERPDGSFWLDAGLVLEPLQRDLADLNALRKTLERGGCEEALTLARDMDVARVTAGGEALPAPGGLLASFRGGCDRLARAVEAAGEALRTAYWRLAWRAAERLEEAYRIVEEALEGADH
ncbi:hypothetical protein CF15_00215 [Pyrodictium occultum]|uniref:Peptidase M28 domain-containing protein n=1 Tax=Pyrodictium occultum TaxID=2309 RepID=A0A0V8RTD7_PYROC|nr:M28 family peptidase [Pyrodictium occultum]KSW11333.1 hypothetical protein CF15_00215 [Pyrodictium occultum]